MTHVPPAEASPHDLDELLRESAPVRDRDLATTAVREALVAVAVAVAEQDRPARSAARVLDHRRGLAGLRHAGGARRRRTVAGIGVAAAVWTLSATGVAAAGGYALYSGFLDAPSTSESVHGEQYVNVGSPEFRGAFDRIASRYPLPAGADYDVLYGNILRTGGLKQLTGTAGEVAVFSSCAWADTWVTAYQNGDTTVARGAVSGLSRAAASPDLAAIDGGGVVDRVSSVARAAGRSDARVLVDYAASADCTSLRR